MSLGRREFLASAGALAVSARSLFASMQAPRAGGHLPGVGPRRLPAGRDRDLHELGGAAPGGHLRCQGHRAGLPTACAARVRAASSSTSRNSRTSRSATALIDATADEIAFTASTSDGENIVVMGLDLPKQGRQHRHRRAALHHLALHVQGAREAGRRAPHRQASQLGDRPQRHGQGDRPQHAARVAGAGVERQRLHARLQGGERAGARARRARSSPTSSRRSARCRWTSRRSASTSPRPAPTSG